MKDWIVLFVGIQCVINIISIFAFISIIKWQKIQQQWNTYTNKWQSLQQEWNLNTLKTIDLNKKVK